MELSKLFDLQIIQTEDIELPGTCEGDILISPTCGGSFEGPLLKGKLLPIGLGTTHTRNQENDIFSKIMLVTEDDEKILMTMSAVFDVDAEVETKLMDGDDIDPGEYYYKGMVSFVTGSEKYKWLERKLCVCDMIVCDWSNIKVQAYMVE